MIILINRTIFNIENKQSWFKRTKSMIFSSRYDGEKWQKMYGCNQIGITGFFLLRTYNYNLINNLKKDII